jgi:nitrate reductase / nitrite oxidoreductase, beta subunit
MAMVFHLDKCIGCHTCSLACKNHWTDRAGADYMWWNNVETKPGTGYPFLYEDQERQHGGWIKKGDSVTLRLHSRPGGLKNIFSNPRLPSLEDYYEPFTYRYGELFDALPQDDQPNARPFSVVSGRDMEIEAGPNWDDDYSGSSVYAANDPNLASLTAEERQSLLRLQEMVFFYLPRICNHCLNPGCAAACPAGAIYKRSEDGIVLVSQDKCRGWRMCVSGCPYKKVYYNWESGKSEKCILCYPRQESEQAPACMHSCVGRIRYLGPLLYDADRIEEAAARPDEELVAAQRALILDPSDSTVVRQAEIDGIPDQIMEAARRSPVYRFVKEWELALPLHPEFRTVPMLFYVPPLLPMPAESGEDLYRLTAGSFSSVGPMRLPVRFLASLLSAGNEEAVLAAYRKLTVLRLYHSEHTVGDIPSPVVREAMAEASTSPRELEEILLLTSEATFEERFVIPSFFREEKTDDPHSRRGSAGLHFSRPIGGTE